jgi:hypothetical protein
MAEQEIIKHTKKVYRVWNSKQHTTWQKIKEFAVEIFIIVFAVTLSIWFHNWSEHRHENTVVKEFLLGLKEDLEKDIKEMKIDSAEYGRTSAAFTYVTSIKYGEVLNADSLNKFQDVIFNTTGLIPNNGRFEGFKSSGKIGLIEDNVLQNQILDLYQEDIPSLISSTDKYTERKKDLFRYVAQNRKKNPDNTYNLNVILSADVGQNICGSIVFVDEILERYGKCIQTSKKIIAKIDGLYSGNSK